jgi:hypothetical protein
MLDSNFRWIIPILFVVPPLATLAHAYFRNRRAKRKAKKDREQEIKNAWERENEIIKSANKKEADFHQAEFVSLRSEIAELVKSTAANYQYAVLSSVRRCNCLVGYQPWIYISAFIKP